MNLLQKQIYDMLMESQYWPPEHMLAYQRSQLAQLLRHAKANVPFYKTRLDPIFKENDHIDWNRWSEIPIVRRHHLVQERDSMLAKKLPQGTHVSVKSLVAALARLTPDVPPTHTINNRLNLIIAPPNEWMN